MANIFVLFSVMFPEIITPPHTKKMLFSRAAISSFALSGHRGRYAQCSCLRHICVPSIVSV